MKSEERPRLGLYADLRKRLKEPGTVPLKSYGTRAKRPSPARLSPNGLTKAPRNP